MVTEQPALSFAGLLRQLRAEAQLTQEELAASAGLSTRSVSNLERGVNRTAHRDTAELLAGALGRGSAYTARVGQLRRKRATAEGLPMTRGPFAPGRLGPGKTTSRVSEASWF